MPSTESGVALLGESVTGSAAAPPFARHRFALRRIRQLASSGTNSIVYSALISNLLRIVSSMTLTRLLDAEAFGIIGIITSMAFVLAMLADSGIQPFLVRHPETEDSDFKDRIWTLRLLRSIGLCLTMAALAWPVALLIQKPALTAVLAIWSLSFLLDGLSSLSFATAIREGRLWRLATFETLSAVATLILSVAFALAMHSYWALVIGMLVGAAVKVLLSYTMFPRSRRRFVLDRARARELWRFSRVIATSSFLSLIIMQSDKLVLARLMPLETFGLYAMATTLATVPIGPAYAWATRVLYPAYAQQARDGDFARPAAFYDRRRWVAAAYMLAVGGLIGGAPLLVAILYDPRYAGVAPLLQVVAVSSALYLITIVSEEALVAAGRTRWTLYGNVARITWLGLGGVIALALHNIFLLIVVVGTREVPAVLSAWTGLRRAGLLDLREEALGLLPLPIGVALSYGIAVGASHLFPAL